jgi:hydrogenase/urease accessory protein HupE
MRTRRSLASLLWLASLLALAIAGYARPAHAHLMPAKQGTVNVVGDGAFVVLSVPVSALHGFDDDGDGLLSMTELRAHQAEVRAEVDRRLVVRDGDVKGETAALDFVLSPAHESRPDLADHVIVLEHARWSAPPTDVRVTCDLFGADDADRQLTITASRTGVPAAGPKVSEAGLFTPASTSHRYFRAPLPALLDQVKVGAAHVLLGTDHLLFLLTVVVAGVGLRYWLSVVTAFTVAHSLTLGAAMLGVVRVPPQVVEPLIAASIVLMAVDNLARASVPTRQRVALVFACGLLHGLGFAASMDALGLDTRSRLVGLVGFNLGIEAGQAAFLAVVVAALGLVRRVVPRLSAVHRTRAVSLAAVVMGVAWLIERVRA